MTSNSTLPHLPSPPSGSAPVKKMTHKEKVLACLKIAGGAGVTNIHLNQIHFRYGASIHRLRKEGYDIETIRESESIYRFRLKQKEQGQFSF